MMLHCAHLSKAASLWEYLGLCDEKAMQWEVELAENVVPCFPTYCPHLQGLDERANVTCSLSLGASRSYSCYCLSVQ